MAKRVYDPSLEVIRREAALIRQAHLDKKLLQDPPKKDNTPRIRCVSDYDFTYALAVLKNPEIEH